MDDSVLTVLEQGDIDMEGLLPWGSNYTFLVRLCHESWEVAAVYKPRQGERPLWDFARGTLCQRERAAYVVAQALGWSIVPPTIMRHGPQGYGSLQLYVEHDPDLHYFAFEGRFRAQVQRICLFDVLINNADRKSGHVLLGAQNHLWAIDHGVCFHADFKLRTVIWEFAGEPIPPELLDDVAGLLDQLGSPTGEFHQELATLLSDKEIRALAERARRLLDQRVFPRPGPGRHYPWPPV